MAEAGGSYYIGDPSDESFRWMNPTGMATPKAFKIIVGIRQLQQDITGGFIRRTNK